MLPTSHTAQAVLHPRALPSDGEPVLREEAAFPLRLHVPTGMVGGWWDPGEAIPPRSPAWPQQCQSRHQLHRRGGKVLPAWSQLGIVMPLVSRNIWVLTSLIPQEMHNFISAVGAHLNGFFLLHTTLLMPSAASGIHAHSHLWISGTAGLCASNVPQKAKESRQQ